MVDNIKVLYCPSFKMIFADPDKIRSKIELSLLAIIKDMVGAYQKLGTGIGTKGIYLDNYLDIKQWLNKLLTYEALTIDIEAFDLKFYKAGLGTITFCWNQQEGIAFPIDLHKDKDLIRDALRKFFTKYKGKSIYHNGSYDVTVLLYQLFMEDLDDTKNLRKGLSILLRNFEDTKLIAYLATNSCSGNELGLKKLAHEFSGDYAVEDIDDITKIPLDKLLTYNLIDGLSTWYVYDKYLPIMIQDQQEDIYRNFFIPHMVDIIEMQLTGLPLDMEEVKVAHAYMENISQNASQTILGTITVQAFTHHLNEQWVIDKNSKYKKKRVTLADANETFNLNSPIQLQSLLYDFMDLPIVDYTDNKQPATGMDTLKKLKNHTQDAEDLLILDNLIAFKEVDKILTAFIPAFLAAPCTKTGNYILFGFFNLGGTVSGRLSSSDVNLQNLPATGSKYAKAIKKCFKAIEGWLLIGADYNSLEDRIGALLTKDTNKLKVYTDGYDGHSLRAYFYYQEQMPDIDPTSVVSINSISNKYKALRQESKPPTFAMTYMGTYNTLMNNCGFSMEKAKQIEDRYHELYKESDAWQEAEIAKCSRDGYATVAFGLRVRTPKLAQVVLGNRATPTEAAAEMRTVNNAFGQSYCLLNSRSTMVFMSRVRSENRLDIRLCALIHDAAYFLIRDDLHTLKYVNDHYVKEMYWQQDPRIQHPTITLGGSLEVFYPSWAESCEIKNEATEEEILETVSTYLDNIK